jgi:hypothetical protein
MTQPSEFAAPSAVLNNTGLTNPSAQLLYPQRPQGAFSGSQAEGSQRPRWSLVGFRKRVRSVICN